MNTSSPDRADEPRPIVILLRTLELGGAERQAVDLAISLAAHQQAVVLAVFERRGALEDVCVEAGLSVVEIGRGRGGFAGVLVGAARVSRRLRPRAVLAYLDGPNLASLAMKAVLPSTRAVWGVRVAGFDGSGEPRNTRVANHLESFFARFSDAAIANSRRGVDEALARGFPKGRTYFVPNGIDVQRFCPVPAERAAVRSELGIPSDAIVIGQVGRLHPMKGWELFLDGAARLAASNEAIWFVAVGDGPTEYATTLRRRASSLGLQERLVWTGARVDVVRIYRALDVLTNTSHAEGFPNVLAEAMATGVPCVATDVGEAALIVDGLGEIVAERSPLALVAAWERLLSRRDGLPPALLRSRIAQEFGLEALRERTLAVIEDR
jgi:glycosyltransferase involved in cell wall biosynthesis